MELSGFIRAALVSAAGIAISSLWQGLLLAAFAWICLKLTPRLSASTRFAVWSAVFAANLLLPIFSIADRTHGSLVPSAVEANHPVVHLDSRWALAIAAFWFVMAAARALSLIRNALRVRALYRRSTLAKINASLQPLLERTARPRSVGIYSSARIDQPCVIGFFRPRILVPEWLLAKATPAEMRQIVLHEASHLRRWDDWTNLLQKLALVLFPLNPALLWIERQLCCTREEACDERVVSETRLPREYAACLTNLAAERMARRMGQTALSLGAWEHRSALAARIHTILHGGSLLSPVKARAIMAGLVMATVSGAVKLSTTPQFVAFTNAERPAREIAEHARPAVGPGMLPPGGYHDVVFREPMTGQNGIGSKLVPTNAVLPSHREATRAARKPGATFGKNSVGIGQASARRASFAADEPRAWIVVTRWESSNDRQAPVIVIQRLVRFSSSAGSTAPNGLATVQTQSGWFVFQL